MESVIKMNKGYFRKGKTQRVFRSEFDKMLSGALYQYEFIKDSGVDYYLSSAGLDFVYKKFTTDPELGELEVPASMFVLAKLQSSPKRMDEVLEEEVKKPVLDAPKKEGETFHPEQNFINQQRFDEIVEKRIEVIRASLKSKGQEYANKDLTTDRMYNFKRGAEISGSTPVSVLFGYWLKHITSTIDIVKQIEQGIIPSETLVEEKLTDMINYTILLDVAIEDARLNEDNN